MAVKRFAILVFILLFCYNAFAATTARQVEFLAAGLEKDGDPCSGCKVYTYETGTTTAKATYLDRAKASPATNPIVLDSEGRAEVFADGLYKFVIKTAADASYFDIDGLNYGASDVVFTSLSQYSGLSEALNDIGATDTVLLVDTTENLGANLTIPSNVTLMVTTPDAININTKTLTINGKIWAPSIEWIIGSSGTVAGTPIVQFWNTAWVKSGLAITATPSYTASITGTIYNSTLLGTTAITGIATINSTSFINASSGLQTDSSSMFKVLITNIGAWDMDATSSIYVYPNLSSSKTILNVYVQIRQDNGSTIYPLTGGVDATNTSPQGNISSWVPSASHRITLHRLTGGNFDGVAFNDTGVDRGWATIIYKD